MSQATAQKADEQVRPQPFPECLFPPDKPYSERETEVRGYADSESEEEYYKKYRDDEIAEFKNELSDTMIEYDALKEELKEISKEIKDRMKPLESERKETLRKIREKSFKTKERLFKIVDPSTNLVGVYDKDGYLQRIEKLKRGLGLQTTIKPLISSDIDNPKPETPLPAFDKE